MNQYDSMNVFYFKKDGIHEPSWEDLHGICPSCSYICKGEDLSMAYIDYVSQYVMMWCDGCGERAVLDLDQNWVEDIKRYTPITVTLEEVDSFSQHRDFFKKLLSGYPGKIYLYKIPFFKILRVINSKLSGFYSEKSIPEEKVRKFIESDYQDLPEGVYEEDIDEDEINFNLSLPCDGYFVEDPNKPYPMNFELNHDGVYVHLLLENGEHVYYWGD